MFSLFHLFDVLVELDIRKFIGGVSIYLNILAIYFHSYLTRLTHHTSCLTTSTQVEIDEGVYAGVFIVTQVRKTLLKKTLFHLSATDKDEFWIRLKRNNKGGTRFRPLRRIVNVTFIDPVPPAGASGAGSHKSGFESDKSAEEASAPWLVSADESSNAAGGDDAGAAVMGKEAGAPHSLPTHPAAAEEGEKDEYAVILNEQFGDE